MNAAMLLGRLSEWYVAQCDGEWEHDFGVTIETCDNPGWLMKVDLTGTRLADVSFAEVGGYSEGEESWIHCRREIDGWVGAGDPSQLEAILRAFLDWADQAVGPRR